MGASCSHPSRVAPAAAAAAPPPPASVTVLWDVENLPIPRRKEDGGREYGTAGDLGEALLAHCLAASGAARAATVAARLVCVHPERYPMPLKNSLRTRGVQMLDAGSKRGAVDTHLKNYMNDAIVDALLEGGARGPAGSGGRWMWLASGDADFAGDVRRARRCGFRVGIIHGAASSADYTEHADASVKWEAVLAECERRVAEKRSSSGGGGGGGCGEGASASGGSPARGAAPAAADEPSAAAAAAASCTSPEAKAQAALPVEGASGGKGGDVPLCRNFSSRRGCTARHCRYRHAPPPQEPAGAAPLQP